MPQSVIFLFNKPFGVLSQFTPGTHTGQNRTLREFGPFPPDVYPVGRLDADSEGLLILTNDRALTRQLLEPVFGHPRTYLVQVEGVPDPAALRRLSEGTLVLDGHAVRPAAVRLLDAEPDLPPRPVPIRFRKNIPTAWIELTLFEGKNRQVRRMTAAAGHPTLRLFRISIGPLSVEGLPPGKWRALSIPESARLQKMLRVRAEASAGPPVRGGSAPSGRRGPMGGGLRPGRG